MAPLLFLGMVGSLVNAWITASLLGTGVWLLWGWNLLLAALVITGVTVILSCPNRAGETLSLEMRLTRGLLGAVVTPWLATALSAAFCALSDASATHNYLAGLLLTLAWIGYLLSRRYARL